MVFAGLDENPNSPYVKSGNAGGGIEWRNISCSGTSNSVALPSATVVTEGVGSQKKVYGSGDFDIGAACSGSLSIAKYIRIVDDNEESAYINGVLYNILGEASTATAGADISAVKVLNHVKLMSPSDYVAPTP